MDFSVLSVEALFKKEFQFSFIIVYKILSSGQPDLTGLTGDISHTLQNASSSQVISWRQLVTEILNCRQEIIQLADAFYIRHEILPIKPKSPVDQMYDHYIYLDD